MNLYCCAVCDNCGLQRLIAHVDVVGIIRCAAVDCSAVNHLAHLCLPVIGHVADCLVQRIYLVVYHFKFFPCHSIVLLLLHCLAEALCHAVCNGIRNFIKFIFVQLHVVRIVDKARFNQRMAYTPALHVPQYRKRAIALYSSVRKAQCGQTFKNSLLHTYAILRGVHKYLRSGCPAVAFAVIRCAVKMEFNHIGYARERQADTLCHHLVRIPALVVNLNRKAVLFQLGRNRHCHAAGLHRFRVAAADCAAVIRRTAVTGNQKDFQSITPCLNIKSPALTQAGTQCYNNTSKNDCPVP